MPQVSSKLHVLCLHYIWVDFDNPFVVSLSYFTKRKIQRRVICVRMIIGAGALPSLPDNCDGTIKPDKLKAGRLVNAAKRLSQRNDFLTFEPSSTNIEPRRGQPAFICIRTFATKFRLLRCQASNDGVHCWPFIRFKSPTIQTDAPNAQDLVQAL